MAQPLRSDEPVRCPWQHENPIREDVLRSCSLHSRSYDAWKEIALSFAELDAWVPVVALLRLTIAVVAAAMIGWERESKDKPAGLRTHMMVSLGAATFILVAMDLLEELSQQSGVQIDPTRVVAGIVGGVGFLGAGAIIRAHGEVHGITTAASVWVAAAIGTAAGLGLYRIVFCVSLLSLVILGVLHMGQSRPSDKSGEAGVKAESEA